MRILNRKDFLNTPPGTIFAAGEPHAYDQWRIKVGNCGQDDWIEQDLSFASMNVRGSQELFNTLDRLECKGESHPLSFSETCRGGDYDSTHFCVMERSDIWTLIRVLESCVEAY